jgi:4-carboxymuconolactone decarboxylase
LARVPLIDDSTEGLDPAQRRLVDAIVATRGAMIRPFEVLAHTPVLGKAVAEVGALLRYGSSLDDHDRELLILATGTAHGCAFVWDSHVDLARAAGVRAAVLDWLRDGGRPDLTDREELIVGTARELAEASTVSASRFSRLQGAFGDAGAIELVTTVGYYTMLAYVMRATDACD